MTYEEFIESLRDFAKNKPIEWNEHFLFEDEESKVVTKAKRGSAGLLGGLRGFFWAPLGTWGIEKILKKLFSRSWGAHGASYRSYRQHYFNIFPCAVL